MSNDDEKWKNTLMWIASVAVSVLCCSTIFVVFASYLIDIKTDMHENSMRLAMIEKRQDAIFAEFDFIHKHVIAGVPMGTPTADGQANPIAGTIFPSNPVPAAEPAPPTAATPPSAAEPPVAPTPVPVAPAPDAGMSPNSAPVVTPPTMPTTPDKK